MALRRFFAGSGNHVIDPIEPGDAVVISKLHSEGFGRPWTDGEFASLLSRETVFGFAARREGKPGAMPDGFVLARLAAGEAEILTIAVARSRRRKGLGRALMDAVLRHLHTERAQSLFLEVDENNTGAIALYNRLRFKEVGRRQSYYGSASPGSGTALVMRREIQ